jgi:hypothetical protein
MKKLFSVLLILTILLIPNIASAYPEINGDKKFVKLVNKAIVLLEQRSPETYNYLMSVDEINCAGTGNALSIAVWGAGKNTILLPPGTVFSFTRKALPYYVAGSLAHEVWHIKNNSCDEKRAFKYQYDVLVTIGAPEFLLWMSPFFSN